MQIEEDNYNMLMARMMQDPTFSLEAAERFFAEIGFKLLKTPYPLPHTNLHKLERFSGGGKAMLPRYQAIYI